MKTIQETQDNNQILSEMFALEIQRARKKNTPSAEDILENLK